MQKSAGIFFILISIFCGQIFSQQSQCYTNEMLQNLSITSHGEFQRIIQTRQQVNQALANARITDEIYTIPVVVHVVYNNDVENIDDLRIFEQINILNEDFRRMNADAANTPDPFSPVAADCNIQFCLASIDPDGNPTTGITRTFSSIEYWPLNNSEKVKNTATGGEDAWPANSYLNIWLCDLQEGVLGYASMPGGAAASDGIVIGYKFFGFSGIIADPYNKGRTATHEVGHWLGLFHIWGDDAGSCDQDDGIDDTPLQASATYGCPEFPLDDECTSEYPGIMFMNYMDYTDDACMNIFTAGQSEVMRTVLETVRGSLLNSPAGCNEIEPLPGNIAELILYPNPSSGQFTIAINNFKGTAGTLYVKVYDVVGHLIAEQHPEPGNYVSAYFDISNASPGCYLIEAFNGTYFLYRQIIVY